MRKTEDGKYLLHCAELAALAGVSIEAATKVVHNPMFDPNDDAIPFYVNRGYKLLYSKGLYADEELDGTHTMQAPMTQEEMMKALGTPRSDLDETDVLLE